MSENALQLEGIFPCHENAMLFIHFTQTFHVTSA